MASPLEMLREAMMQQRADQDLGPLIEQALSQFDQRFAGAPGPMHVPEYRVIDQQPATSENWFLEQGAPGYAQDQKFGKGMSEMDPAHIFMPIPTDVTPPTGQNRILPGGKVGVPDVNAPWGGGGYEDKTPLMQKSQSLGGPPALDPSMFPGLEDFLSPGMME